MVGEGRVPNSKQRASVCNLCSRKRENRQALPQETRARGTLPSCAQHPQGGTRLPLRPCPSWRNTC